MNKVTRTITMTGLAVATGLAMGVGPAAASPAASAAPAAKVSAVQVQDHKFAKKRLVDFYRSPQACFRAGKMGEFRKKWNSFDCERVKRGPKRGWVALTAGWEFKGHGHHGHQGPKGHGHQGPKGHGHR